MHGHTNIKNPQRTLHQDLQQITQVLQLCYIVHTANVEHVSYENCDENNICVYFTYNIKTVKDRVFYVTSFKHGCKFVRWYCCIALCQGTLQHGAQSVCVQTAMCVERRSVRYGFCSGNKTCVSTGRHRDTIVTRVQL